MDKNELDKRAHRRREIIYGQEYHTLLSDRISSLMDMYDAIPGEKPVAKEFEEWVYKMLTDADYVVTPEMSKEWAKRLGESLEWRTDGTNPLKEKKEKKAAEGSREVVTAQATTAWDPVPTEELDRNGIYAPTTVHTRYSPDNPGVQMMRIKDKVYQDPISGNTYSWETGVHQQTSPLWNDAWINGEHPTLLDAEGRSDISRTEGKPDYDYDHPYHGDDHDPDQTTSDTGWSDDPIAFRGQEYHSDKWEKKSSLKGFSKKADIFAPTTMTSRSCPDHPGSQLLRVTDNVRQCPVDHRVYDYTEGFTTDDGKEHSGGSIAEQTPSIPGYYQSPHPSLSLFPSQGSATKGLSKRAFDLRGAEQRFIFDLSHALKGDRDTLVPVSKVVDIASKGDPRPLTQIIQDVYSNADSERAAAKGTEKEEAALGDQLDREVDEVIDTAVSV